MHLGFYDDEAVTLTAMQEYACLQGFDVDINDRRYHHEIYLTDARRCAPDKLKTVIRLPVKEKA